MVTDINLRMKSTIVCFFVSIHCGIGQICLYNVNVQSSCVKTDFQLGTFNAALGKATKMSSTSLQAESSLANDNDTNPSLGQCAQTDVQTSATSPHWWLVDLNSWHRVYSVLVSSSQYENEKLTFFDIRSYKDFIRNVSQITTYDLVRRKYQICSPYQEVEIESSVTKTFICPEEFQARYLVLFKNSPRNTESDDKTLSLCEVQVVAEMNCEDGDICKNGGTCNHNNGEPYKCSCPPGWKGKFCETIMNCDDGNVCLNGGSCSHINGRPYTCACAKGWKGTYCETPMDCDDGNFCINGQCSKAANGSPYKCDCDLGWKGKFCETTMTCDDGNLCRNMGVCSHKYGEPYLCTCRSKIFTGQFCENRSNTIGSQDSQAASSRVSWVSPTKNPQLQTTTPTISTNVTPPTNMLIIDTDRDGIFDHLDDDDDNDGILDVDDLDMNNDGIINRDTDGDGIPEHLDLDDDNDGILDSQDFDDDNDGILDVDDPDSLVDVLLHIDTDGDGTPDILDMDDDNDGVVDPQDFDDNGDGKVDVDSDGDGLSDWLDPDDDNDGYFDISLKSGKLISNANSGEDKGLSKGGIAGVSVSVIGVSFIMFSLFFIICLRRRKKKSKFERQQIENLERELTTISASAGKD